jgi:DNA ligase-1
MDASTDSPNIDSLGELVKSQLVIRTPPRLVIRSAATPSTNYSVPPSILTNIAPTNTAVSTGEVYVDNRIPTFRIDEDLVVILEAAFNQTSVQNTQIHDPRIQMLRTYMKWRLVPLYKENTRGSPMMWWVGFDLQTHELLLTHGHVDGAIRTDRTRVVVNQSGRNLHQQSTLEVQQRYNLKFREGYRPIGASAPEIDEPMLAAKWEPDKTRLDFPVGIQPKIDGIRCLARKTGSNLIRYRSRGNREYPHFNPQFDTELDNFFSFLPNAGVELDGEMYIHGIDFSLLSSIVRNEKTPHSRLPELIYYIFDFNTSDPLPYESRYAVLCSSMKRYLESGYTATRFLIVPTHFISSRDEIINCQKYYIENGYEGAMIRKLANGATEGRKLECALYKSGRSNNLLKVKTFIDEECIIIRVEDAKGTEAGAALLVVRDIRNNELTLRPSATFDNRREWLINPNLVINKRATIVYQELSAYNVPRFPVLKAIRDYE